MAGNARSLEYFHSAIRWAAIPEWLAKEEKFAKPVAIIRVSDRATAASESFWARGSESCEIAILPCVIRSDMFVCVSVGTSDEPEAATIMERRKSPPNFEVQLAPAGREKNRKLDWTVRMPIRSEFHAAPSDYRAPGGYATRS